MTKDKLDELTRTRKWAHQKLIDKGSKVYQAFAQMERATFSDGALNKKQKELIAIGISVRIDCEACMQWHIEQAATAGASYEEVLEAVEIGSRLVETITMMCPLRADPEQHESHTSSIARRHVDCTCLYEFLQDH